MTPGVRSHVGQQQTEGYLRSLITAASKWRVHAAQGLGFVLGLGVLYRVNEAEDGNMRFSCYARGLLLRFSHLKWVVTQIWVPFRYL